MRKSALQHKTKAQNLPTPEPSQTSGFRGYDPATFCVYTASELTQRFKELHGDRALIEAEHLLELAINSQDPCQIETWTYLVSALDDE